MVDAEPVRSFGTSGKTPANGVIGRVRIKARGIPRAFIYEEL